MNIAVYLHDNKQPQIEVMRAFYESIGPDHTKAIYRSSEGIQEADLHVTMGFQCGSDDIIIECMKKDLDYIFFDHAYFQRGYDKGNFRATRKGIMAYDFKKRPTDRLDKFEVKLGSWKENGNIILLIPPPEKHIKIFGLSNWLEKTYYELQKHTTRAIVVKHKFDPRPLGEYLMSAHALVAHNSIAAVESACYGVPVFVDELSPACPVGCTDFSRIERPIYPDRKEWAASLSYCQFSANEIVSGQALHELLGEEGGL